MEILKYSTYLTEALPCIFCIIFFKKIITKDIKVFFIYTSLFLFFFLLQLYFRYGLHSYPLKFLVIRINIITEFILLGLFYYYNVRFKYKKEVLIVASVGFILFSIYDYHVTAKDDFRYLPLVIQASFFLVVIPYFFYENMRYSLEKPVYLLPSFWISIAFLIYFSGNFFQFLGSEIYEDKQFIDLSNLVYDVVTIIKDTLLCIAIVVNNSIEKETHKPNMPINFDLGF